MKQGGASSVKHKLVRCACLLAAVTLFLGAMSPAVMAAPQEERRNVSRADYPLWHKLLVPGEKSEGAKSTSRDGNWAAYFLKYDSVQQKDELRVASLSGGAVHSIPDGTAGRFSKDSGWFFYLTSGGGFGALDLIGDESILVPGATTYDTIDDDQVVVAYVPDDKGHQSKVGELLLIDLRDGSKRVVDDVSIYKAHPKGEAVAYVLSKNGQESLEVSSSKGRVEAPVVAAGNHKFTVLTWNDTGSALAYIQKSASTQAETIGLYAWLSKSGSARVLAADRVKGSSGGESAIAESTVRSLHVSDDLRVVLFTAWKNTEVSSSGRVEIWNALSSKMLTTRTGPAISTMAWLPSEDRIVRVTKEGQSLATLVSSRTYAIVLSPRKKFLPNDSYELDNTGMAADVYLVYLKDGTQKRILRRQDVARMRNLSVSPEGRYISYFRNGGWWVYDIEKDTHSNVTSRVSRSLVEPWPTSGSFTNAWMDVPYGSPGWIGDDDCLVFYDEFDLWKVSPDGSDLQRITEGRETRTRYRIYMPAYESYDPGSLNPASPKYEAISMDVEKGILISSFDTRYKRSGYSRWTGSVGVTGIVSGDEYMNFIERVADTDRYLYRRQRFDLPPELVMIDAASGRSEVIATSNSHHYKFNWGRAELINYSGADGGELQGILYYPANYDASKKYPMVVSIYEEVSHRLHEYINPSTSGFDPVTHYISNLTLDGYFVLRPDIRYEPSNPGVSATECVVTAVEHVLRMGIIDEKSVGLMGHSFGGYETSFIITQTDLFAAAVSGAAVTDLVSFYLDMEHGIPGIYMFEAQQFRMPVPFHLDQEAYLRNSPIHNAESISTPLLSWTGTDDSKVPASHAFKMYNILRRMRKENILVVYPGEGHVLSQMENGEDLYNRTMAWFAHHLKKSPAESWILDNAEASRDLEQSR